MVKRLGKRQREALRSNNDRKLRLMTANGRNGYALFTEQRQDSTARISKAYNPDPLTLNPGGRGRLIHNATGSVAKKPPKPRGVPFDNSATWLRLTTGNVPDELLTGLWAMAIRARRDCLEQARAREQIKALKETELLNLRQLTEHVS